MPKFFSFDKMINLLVVLFATVLPLGHAIANITLGLMSIVIIFYLVKNYKEEKSTIVNSLFIILIFSCLFFIYIISIFYSIDIDTGFFQVIKKGPLFVLPLFVFLLRKKIKPKSVKLAIDLYVVSLTFVCFISLVMAVFNSYNYKFDTIIYFASDQNLASSFISYHKLYLSLYITIAIFFLINSIYSGVKTGFLGIGKFKFFQLIILLLTLILLGGRNSILLSFLIIIGYATSYSIKNKVFIKYIGLCLVLFGLGISSMFINPNFREKVKEAINYENKYNIDKRWGGFSVRKIIWEKSYNIFKRNPLFGVGAGDVQQELNTEYLDVQTSALDNGVYNAHNDLLQIAITTGVIGLCLFILSIVFIFRLSFANQNYIHCFFIILFLISGLTESFLERDMGIRIYSFFSILLFISNMKEDEGSTNTQ